MIEKRTSNFEVDKIADSGDTGALFYCRGHAAVFERLSENLGGFREKIARGAFDSALDGNQDVRALINHDENLVLGRTVSNTLELRNDPYGLHVWIKAPDTTYANDLRTLMERGDVSQMSFAFTVADDSWDVVDGETIRTVRAVDRLFDVSVVTYPAYPQTDASLRSLYERALADGRINGLEVVAPEGEGNSSAAQSEGDEERKAAILQLRKEIALVNFRIEKDGLVSNG